MFPQIQNAIKSSQIEILANFFLLVQKLSVVARNDKNTCIGEPSFFQKVHPWAHCPHETKINTRRARDSVPPCENQFKNVNFNNNDLKTSKIVMFA